MATFDSHRACLQRAWPLANAFEQHWGTSDHRQLFICRSSLLAPGQIH